MATKWQEHARSFIGGALIMQEKSLPVWSLPETREKGYHLEVEEGKDLGAGRGESERGLRYLSGVAPQHVVEFLGQNCKGQRRLGCPDLWLADVACSFMGCAKS